MMEMKRKRDNQNGDYAQNDYCRCRILWRESNVDKPIMRRTDGPLEMAGVSQWMPGDACGCLNSGRQTNQNEGMEEKN